MVQEIKVLQKIRYHNPGLIVQNKIYDYTHIPPII